MLLATAFPLAFPFPFSVAAFDVILVGTSVTLNTIVEIADAFLDMLAANVCQRVLVATVAGVAPVVITQMAGHTTRVVVAVQDKVLVVIEACR